MGTFPFPNWQISGSVSTFVYYDYSYQEHSTLDLHVPYVLFLLGKYTPADLSSHMWNVWITSLKASKMLVSLPAMHKSSSCFISIISTCCCLSFSLQLYEQNKAHLLWISPMHIWLIFINNLLSWGGILGYMFIKNSKNKNQISLTPWSS